MMQQHCFVIQRKVTSQVWTVQGESKRTVMAFREHVRAKSFLKLIDDCETKVKGNQRQKLIIEKYPINTLHRRCSLNALGMILVTCDGSFLNMSCIDQPNDDITFHLENCLRYY